MITLITGAPGAGKTAFLVSKLLSGDFGKDRPLFVLGVPGLTLPHEVLPPVDEWTISESVDGVVEHSFSFPAGSLIVIDEAQKVFRPRSAASKVPPYVQAFEKHRHLGLDFVLLTQHPGLIDTNIRKLTGKHLHIHQTWAGRELLEWSTVVDPSSKSDRASAVKTSYRLPKAAFSQYKSAEIHTQQKRRIPFQAYLFVLLLLGVVGGFFYMKSKIFPAPVPVPVPGVSEKESEQVPSQNQGSQSQSFLTGSKSDIKSEDFEPRLVARPETAPLYDGVRQVVAMPMVKGCLQTRSVCKCYTDQATDAGLDDNQCRHYMEHPYFQPFALASAANNSASTSPVSSSHDSR